MTEEQKKKTANLEDLQAFARVIHNKGIGSEGTCTTAAGTAAKAVTVGTTFNPVAGATLLVTFQNAITVADATLTVTYGASGSQQTLAAKPIYYRGSALGANLVKAGSVLFLRYDGTSFNIIGDLDTDTNTVTDVSYDTTNKKLTKTVGGTTTDIATAVKIVEDAGGLRLTPLNLLSLAHDYVFKLNDALCIDGIIYRCTAASTTKPPFNFVFDENNSIVYDTINGQEAFAVDSGTLNTGWEAYFDLNDRYFVESVAAKKADKATTLAGYGIIDAYTKNQIDALTRHTRKTDFDLNDLKKAVADQNLEKYGLKVGDQKTINGHTYVIAGLNPMKGITTPNRLTQNHVGLIVIPHTTQAWNASGNTSEGAGNRGAGYANCDLHYYLKNTLLPLVGTDLGAANLLGHSKLLSNAVTDGKSSNCTWEADCKICTLSEVQVYGATVWSSSGYDTGEACRQLDVFQRYSHTEIFGGEYVWLRDVASASYAAVATDYGIAAVHPASLADYVAALILFH